MAKKRFYVRPDGLHEAIRVINGKRVAFRGKSDREVEQKMLSYKEQLEIGRPFRKLADEWERERFPQLANGTQMCYHPALKRAIAEFGDTPMRKILAINIQRFINDLAKKGNYSAKTVSTQLSVISLICEFSVVQGEIDLNPCASIKIPRHLPKETREAATEAQQESVGASCNATFCLFAWLCLYAGLRRGEAMGLSYEDIDFDAREIHVRNKLIWKSNRPEIQNFLKTAAGERDIPLIDKLYNAMDHNGKGLIFTGDNGGPLTESEYRTLYANYCHEIGCAHEHMKSTSRKDIKGNTIYQAAWMPDFTPHQLRHCYATYCYDAGVDSKAASKVLGHSKESVTRDIYTHISLSKEKETAHKLNEFFAANTEKTQKAV